MAVAVLMVLVGTEMAVVLDIGVQGDGWMGMASCNKAATSSAWN